MSGYTANSSYIEVDLQNYGDCRIAENGVVEISRSFSLPIIITMGRSSLELTRIEMPPSAAQQERDKHRFGNAASFTNAYILRNTSSESSGAVLAFGEDDFDTTFEIGGYTVQTNSSFIIGRETTPELDLDQTVSREHANVRIGNWSQNLHFHDLDTTNGTRIKVEEFALHDTPRRYLTEDGNGNIVMRAEQQQRWER